MFDFFSVFRWDPVPLDEALFGKLCEYFSLCSLGLRRLFGDFLYCWFRFGFKQQPEVITRIEKRDYKKEQAQYQIGAERRHVTYAPAFQVVTSQAARAQEQGNQCSPNARVEFEKVTKSIVDQFPQANQPAVCPLPANRTVLTFQATAAVQTVGAQSIRQIMRRVFAKHPACYANLVAKLLGDRRVGVGKESVLQFA